MPISVLTWARLRVNVGLIETKGTIMRAKAILSLFTILIAGAIVGCAQKTVAPAEPAGSANRKAGKPTTGPATRRRGFAMAREGRPESFPHRIWAFTGFEARPVSFGWFGKAETKNIPQYAGNTAGRRAVGPYKKHAALMVGCNPVPGPRMGKQNRMYCRYFMRGGDQATFQHFSLSSNDNCNIRVSGLKQGKWTELVLNYTRDSRRNDGSPGAFREGERMDDLKVFVGKPGDGKRWEFILDDVIFFAVEPNLPPEPEPFPKRVMFLAAFDTGIDPASRGKFFPGKFDPVSGREAPRGSYWVVAKAVPAEDAKGSQVLLEMKPARSVGPNTKLRFRYWVKGSDGIRVALRDATGAKERIVKLTGCKQAEWVTRYVTFSEDEKFVGGGKFAVGNKVDMVTFTVPAAAELYVDEVVLFDAGKPKSK